MTPFSGRIELYHLGRDPGEMVNLAEQETQRVNAMRRKLAGWRRDSFPAGTPDPGNLERLRSLGYTH